MPLKSELTRTIQPAASTRGLNGLRLVMHGIRIVISVWATVALGMAADVPAAAPEGPQLGSAAFSPSPQHPVGDLGDGTGRYPGATDPCLSWQEHGGLPGPDKNLLWETRLNGWTQSHPIVVGSKLITLEEPNVVVGLDASTGKLLWRTVCDHLTLFPQEEQKKARALMQHLTELIFKVNVLHDEYTWLNGTWDYPGGEWDFPISGHRPRKGNIDDTQATKDRLAAIEKEWAENGFDGTPLKPYVAGHGLSPFSKMAEEKKGDTTKYDAFVRALADCRMDYGMCPDLFDITIQPQTHGQTQDTPTSDGSYIYVTFGYGQTSCLDLEGKVKWMKWFPENRKKAELLAAYEDNDWWFIGSKIGYMVTSPVLVDDKLIVTQGFAIRALDKATGDLLWTVTYPRGLDGRGSDRGPALMTLADGTKVIVCPQGYVIRVSDGKVMCAENPMTMFNVPFGSNHAYVMGVVTHGDICYFAWAIGAGAIQVTRSGPDTVTCHYLWLQAIPGLVPAGCTVGHGFNRGDTTYESFIEGAPVYDPDRMRVYISLHLYKTLWSFDAKDGHPLDCFRAGRDLPKHDADVVSPYLAHGGSNELTDPVLVGGRYLFVPNDMGDCYVLDADDIHKVLGANNVMTQFHRDLALWVKPWAEIGRQITDHYLYNASDTACQNDTHSTPGDPFINGDKIYIRTLEGMTCVSKTSAAAPVLNDAETASAPKR